MEALRQYTEIPESEFSEDFKWLDHGYAQAICRGPEEGLAVDTEEEPFDSDEVLTAGFMRNVLTNFAGLCPGLDDFVITLEGEDGEPVMDLGECMTAFYAELEEILKDKAA